MNAKQFKEAVRVAMSSEDLQAQHLHPFDGLELPAYQPVYCTLRQVARLIRWQALQFNGQLDAKALEEIAHFGRSRFVIVGEGA